jgi:hypothetical protein
LFLASIAPGVAERHIANLEAAARAERERREAEAREAEAAAAAAAVATQSDENSGNSESRVESGNEGTNASTIMDADQSNARRTQENEGPLVEDQGVQEDNQRNEQPREQLIPL